MKASDLDLRELLEFEPDGGVLSFAGQRALLFDAVALGLLRKELVGLLGRSAARGVLTRFGYAHGWRTAETLKEAFPWDDDLEWQAAGARLHSLQGLVMAEPLRRAQQGERAPFIETIWRDSYEAEQHLLHLGQADEPVCWTLTGFASGYLSFCYGRDVVCVEERCLGKGDAVCGFVARPREQWGAEVAAHLSFYDKQSLDESLLQLTKELERVDRRLRARRSELDRNDPDVSGLVARSGVMSRVVELARRVAKVDATVLITGESGVGKERVARLIHAESSRPSGPFVAINCGAVPDALLESELFGHAEGAFTSATRDRVGIFEAASGGTLLLDEIGEVPPSMQVKLLRALQEREVRRVGETKVRKVDVRVLAATNRDLPASVQAGQFRRDLFYRLRVVELHVPPLRERREDILPLVRALLAAAAARMGRTVTGITPAAANQLVRYGWPGNVRELENAVERAVALATSHRIDVDDLPEEVVLATPGAYAPGDVRTLDEVERDYILAVVKANAGNKAAAAGQLKIGIATLYRKLKQYESAGVRP